MKYLLSFFLIMLAVVQLAPAAPAERSPVKVLYVGNEGFLIECAQKKIVIDAFFGGWEAAWCYTPPDSAVNQMKNNRPPFDDIDIIAVTHAHRDHFDAGITAEHLKNNKDAIVICPPQVEEELQELAHDEDFKNRIRTVSTPGDSAIELHIAGIDLLVFSTAHSKYMETDQKTGEKVDRHRTVQHLEFLVTIDGRKLFHCGDSAFNHFLLYRSCGLDTTNIDVAFLGGRAGDLVQPENIILMHRIPGRTPSGPTDYFQPGVKRVIEAREPMQAWEFE